METQPSHSEAARTTHTSESNRIRKLAMRSNILVIAVIVLAVVAVYQIVLLNGLTASLSKSNAAIHNLQTELAHLNLTSNGTAGIQAYNISGALLVPPTYLNGSPVVTSNETFGSRLTGINEPLNASDLSIINNASDSYFETAGEMYLNGSLKNYVGTQPSRVSQFIVNGKPSVIYLGSITCIFCGENRWAMALALGRFGKFGSLYKGYSSFGDGDLPTLYWRPNEYNSSAMDLGDFYNSTYVNFIALEDTDPITQGFQLQPLSTMQSEVNATGNLAYADAMAYIIKLNQFSGTPYTIWGSYASNGADAVDFGNTTPSAPPFPLTNMTHAQVLQQLAHPNDQFAWTEYAGADVYIALTCASINNTAQVCAIPAIPKIEAKLGVS